MLISFWFCVIRLPGSNILSVRQNAQLTSSACCTLKMQASGSSEKVVKFYWTSRGHIPNVTTTLEPEPTQHNSLDRPPDKEVKFNHCIAYGRG
jgi:hypothetical protein